MDIRHDWNHEEIYQIYEMPLIPLVMRAVLVHQKHHMPGQVHISGLLSIKTGGCVEACAYCPQAARYHTGIKVHALMAVSDVLAKAKEAKQDGASRFCMGASWREVRDNRDFDRVIEMLKGVNELGMEVCCTLGMLSEKQAQRLEEAGLHSYNHNIDTSEDYYNNIIKTRTFDNRLKTLQNVRKVGLSVCSGGIIGLGETPKDRVSMLKTLANLPKHPESVPINALVPIEGTPLGNASLIPFEDMVRMIATARIVLPETMLRLSAGRLSLSIAEQAMCFMAGANSIFAGDKLLTTSNPNYQSDLEMFQTLGLTPMEPFAKKPQKSPEKRKVQV